MEDTRWRDNAECISDPEPFYTPDPEDRGATKLRREAIAKAACGRCQVREKCLEWELEFETTAMAYHVYGGLGPDERKEILRNRRRQRDIESKRKRRQQQKEAAA